MTRGKRCLVLMAGVLLWTVALSFWKSSLPSSLVLGNQRRTSWLKSP